MTMRQVQKTILQDSPLTFTLDHILDANECRALIEKSEKEHDYSQAQITVGPNRYRTNTEIRNNDRVIFDDVDLAGQLFEKVRPFLPNLYEERWHLKGLNERFRFYRYGKGQQFRPHYDGAFERYWDEMSFLTLIFYLNDGFDGGETTFFYDRSDVGQSPTPRFVIAPKTGSALIFDHQQLHEGSEVTDGVKYVLRTDVMYCIPDE